MVHQFVDGSYRHTNLPDESGDYLTAREELRLAEVELIQQRERVASLRRALPQGPILRDYEFVEGPADLRDGDSPVHPVKLSALFSQPGRPLVLYHLMYGKKQGRPCPMCTLWTDASNGVAEHLAQNIDFAIIAAADPKSLRDHARSRGWDRLRLLSAAESTFKFDLGSEDAEGNQDSAVSVIVKEADGTLRHLYTAHPRIAPDIKERGIDLLVPVWHYLDLSPKGREQWYPSLDYGTRTSVATGDAAPATQTYKKT